MRLKLKIDYDIDEHDPDVEALLDEIVADEARKFMETVMTRLEAEGVTDVRVERYDEDEG